MVAGKPAPDGNRVDVLGGWTVASWAGMNLHDAAHLIGPNEFQLLENARWAGSRIVPRGGQQKYTEEQPAGAGYALWGAYGGHMGHGGIGGTGFKDTPGDETPASFIPASIMVLWSL